MTSHTASGSSVPEPRPWRFRDPDAPALFLHARDGHWDDVASLLRSEEHRPAASYVDPSGYTALHYACWESSCPVGSVVEPLLDAHPDAARLGNGKGRTPLHLACWRGSDDAVLAVLRRRPDAASALDRNGKSPLRDACLRYRSAEVLRALAAADRSAIGKADRWGRTPILGFFRIVQGRAEGLLRGGGVGDRDGDARAQCEDVLGRAAVLLAAEAGLPTDASAWEIAAASVTSPSCPYSVFALLAEMYPRLASVPGPGTGAEHLLHVAARIPPRSLQLDLYRCDKCGELPLDGDAVCCNANPRGAHWGVRCVGCLGEGAAENYEWVIPEIDKPAAVIERVLAIDPVPAGIRDQDGNLPLVSAIKSGKDWDGCIKSLFLAAPGALRSHDVETSMLPFMIAAVSGGRAAGPEGCCADVNGTGAEDAKDLRCLQTVFGLIIEDPTVIELGLPGKRADRFV